MKEYSNRMLLDSLRLPVIADVYSLAQEMRLSEKLIYYLACEDAYGRYKTFYIAKRDGTPREINAPIASLKIVQRWILENILYNIKVSNYSFGFNNKTIGSPLVMCAEKHKNNLYMLRMDLKNFFPSISRERVFYQFVNMGYNTYASNLLTNICVDNDKLPQGAVTSPYLANIICYKLDIRIATYCNKRDITYTRYADDLTFSSDNRDALRNIYGMIKKIVQSEGFSVNENKTYFMTPKCHKKLLGLTINDNMIKAPKEFKRMVRAMIHQSIIAGEYGDNRVIKGYISYIDSIESGYMHKIIKYISKFLDDTITLFPDAVAAFNANKLFKEVPDMEIKQPRDFVGFIDAEEYLDMVTEEREQFLIKNGYNISNIL